MFGLTTIITCPVGRGCRIYQLHLCRREKHHPSKCPGHVTNSSDVETPVMLELWGMWSTPSLPLLTGPLLI